MSSRFVLVQLSVLIAALVGHTIADDLTCGAFLDNTDLPGIKLDGSGKTSSSKETCVQRCEDTANCNAAIRIADGRCFLKQVDTAIAAPVGKTGITSYVICSQPPPPPTESTCGHFLPGMDIPGANLLGRTIVFRSSQEECLAVCEATPGCNTAVRKNKNGRCFLKEVDVDSVEPVSDSRFTSYMICPTNTAECAVASDCIDGPDDACNAPVCTAGTCGTTILENFDCSIDGKAGTCDAEGTCVPAPECTVAADCTGGPDDDCNGPVCTDGVCGTTILEGSDCLIDDKDGWCDASGTCEANPECTVAADCTDGLEDECNAPVCTERVCGTTVLEGGDCTIDGEDGTCDAAGSCVANPECTADADCTEAGKSICNTNAGVCVECYRDAQCPDFNQKFAPTYDCQRNQCINNECVAGDPFRQGRSCNGDRGTCDAGTCEERNRPCRFWWGFCV